MKNKKMITTLFEALGDIEKTMEENTIASVFDRFIAESTLEQATGDYVGEDGLLYCGVCNTRKQTKINMPFMGVKNRVIPCLCNCAVEKRDREQEERASAQKREQIAKARRAGFPDWELSQCTFDNDDQKTPRLTEAMKRYCFNFPKFKEEGKGLLLYGSVETGKTFYACCIANELIDKGFSCLATNFSRIVNTVWSMDDKQGYYDMLNSFDLLVIDDLGAERTTEYMQEIIFNVIDSRDRAGLPMIITTNLSLDDMKNPQEIEKQRIYSRILKGCFPVKVEGVARRREIVKRDYGEMKDLLGL